MNIPEGLGALPVTTQVAVNIAIFIGTAIYVIYSHIKSKNEKAKPDVTIASSNLKFLEDIMDNFDVFIMEIKKISTSVENISKTIEEMSREDSREREYNRGYMAAKAASDIKRGVKPRKDDEDSIDTAT